MLNKCSIFIVQIVGIITLCAPSISYASETDGSFWYELNGDEATVTGTRSMMGNSAYIPSQVTFNNLRYNVVKIDDDAFDGWQLLEYCRIPEGVRSIGQSIFSNTKVSSIVVPSTVQSAGGFNSGAFNNSTMRTIIYLPPTPPRFWNAVSNTYVIDPELYTNPIYKTSNAKIKGIIEFSSHEFDYSGEAPTFSITNNLQAEGWKAEYTLPELEKDAGSYEVIIPIKFQNRQTYERFTANVPYKYVIKKQTLKVTIKKQIKSYGDDNPPFTYGISGFIGNDNESDIQVLPTILCSATKLTEIGEYQIIGSGGQSTNYDFEFYNGLLTIKKASLSINVIDDIKEYGDPNPQFKINFIGLKNGEQLPRWDISPIFSTEATEKSNVGTYSVSVICEAHNYEIESNRNGILNITRANATITANNKNRLYFEENPQFDFSITGLRNGDTKTCVTTLPSYNCEANILSDVGVYEIVPSDAVAKNYIFEYVPGNLSINKRQLTANVGNYSRVYGENNPKFEVTYSGFVNNEDASVLLQSATISCTANSLSDVGSYPIEISGGEAKNYQISKYNFGTLTITKTNQNIIWDQDLSNIDLYSQIELQATSDANLPVTYEMSPNNVATIYNNAGKWYLDCYGSGAVNIRAIQNGDKNHNAAAIITKTLVVFGGGDDPSNPQIYLNVEDPGTLPTMIAENKKYQIKNLRLTGYLNGTDVNYIREMCGSDSYGNSTVGVLETLDISGCTIVSGGRSYYQSNRTSDNIVGNYMFYNCKVLTTLSIPNNTTSLGDYAFADCERLSTISLSNSIKSFGVQSFRNNISLQRLSLPNELEIIGDMAFLGCTGLTEITIPSSVTYIGSGITKECQNLARIVVEADNTQYDSSDGVLYNSALNELMAFPISYSESEYMVPNGVVKISSYAFENAKDLKSVSLPASLLSIGQDAFIGCVNLTNLQVQALNPPTCQNNCFDNISKTRCELQVPIGCRSYYWVAPVWSEFNKIVETDFSGISNVNYDDVQVEIVNGKIKISGCPGNLIVRIYHINGTLVYQDLAQSNIIQFEPSSIGIYLVVIGSKTYKRLFKFY